MTNPQLLITTLAIYQTVFWAPVGEALAKAGFKVAFLAFDDASHAHLAARGLESFNAYEQGEPTYDVAALAEIVRSTLDGPLSLWTSHERITFAIRDSEALARKLARQLHAAGKALDALAARAAPVTVVQELGGFLSVIGTYIAARRRGIDNVFLEPSFFRGRFFPLWNSFAAPAVADPGRASGPYPPSAEVRAYLDAARASRAIVVPTKDRHHYQAALGKIANAKNMKRLVEKLHEKYVRGQRHEFGYIGTYVGNHLRMLANGVRLRGAYTPLERLGRFVYYPLHVPADVALTLRSPEFVDQLALVDYLVRNLPDTHSLAIKEHPAMVGAIDARRLREMLARHDRLALLPPTTNNYLVLDSCDAVVSVNSKAGAEALLLGKPVVVLGDAFYKRTPLVAVAPKLTDAPRLIGAALARTSAPDPERVAGFFTHVWQQTHPGELYDPAPANVATFAASIAAALRAREPALA